MAVYVNGIKIAGHGRPGLSPYQIAVDEGYTGTESAFNAQLAAIGEAVAGFDELSNQVDNAKLEVETAVARANLAISQALRNIADAKVDIESTVNTATLTINDLVTTATTNLNNAVTGAEARIDEKIEEALASIPESENLVTKNYLEERLETVTVDLTGYATETYVDNAVNGLATETYVNNKVNDMATQTWVTTQINDATASIVTDIWYYGSSAPSNTKLLWIDSNSSTGGLKYYRNGSWQHVPVAWS